MNDFCCGTCVFWREGHCIRFPPVREAGGRAWPPTAHSDLCGEHRTTGEERRSGFWRPAARRINAGIARVYGAVDAAGRAP